ncbi:MAG: twin-arginine translocase TatA/TatE family subunit [Dehalococcoidia bacterium]
MFSSLGAPELIIIAVVLVLLFGVGKLSGLGRGLGDSIKEFRKAVKDEDQPGDTPSAPAAPTQHQASTQAPIPPAQPPAEQQKPNVF